MINTYQCKIGKLSAPFELKLGAEALLAYEYFNNKILQKSGALPGIFRNTINLLDKLNHHSVEHNFYEFPYEIEKNDFCRNVLLAFSGSLDSIYQLFNLKESGYNVTLFYLNYNTLLGSKRLIQVKTLSENLNLPLVICNFELDDSLYVQNSFGNLLMYSLMLDCCQDRNIYYISSGDSLLNKRNTKTLSNQKRVTETFFNELYLKFNFDFVASPDINKINKLVKLKELNLDQVFTDCINTDKFLKINKNKLVTRLHLTLPNNNCGICPKCAFYNLLRHYYFNENLPQKYLDYCWKTVITENTYDLFNIGLSLATRINNLANC